MAIRVIQDFVVTQVPFHPIARLRQKTRGELDLGSCTLGLSGEPNLTLSVRQQQKTGLPKPQLDETESEPLRIEPVEIQSGRWFVRELVDHKPKGKSSKCEQLQSLKEMGGGYKAGKSPQKA